LTWRRPRFEALFKKLNEVAAGKKRGLIAFCGLTSRQNCDNIRDMNSNLLNVFSEELAGEQGSQSRGPNIGERSERPNYFDGADPARQVDRRHRGSDGDRKHFEVSKMWEVHHEICRRLLLGQKASHIARDLEVSEVMVSYVRNSRVVQDRLAEMKGARDANTVDLAKAIREKAPTALKLLERIIEGEVDAPITTRAREANNWLDRAGFAAVRTIQAQHVHAHFTAEEIEALKQRAVENGFAKPSPTSARLASAASRLTSLDTAQAQAQALDATLMVSEASEASNG
jgi:hypothetical protein